MAISAQPRASKTNMRNLRQALLLAAASIVVCAASARTVPIATIVALQPSSSLLPACEDDLPSSEAESDSALEALAVFVGKKKISTKGSDWKTRVPQAPKLPFDPWSQYLWHVRTNVGDMTFALMPEVAPRHTESVIHLARLGFFDDTGFHRVINGFMAQGGCPLGNGTGYPGYRMDCEFSDDVRHDVAGRLSAANSGPGTESSQFFVTFGEMPHLDDVHTIMGQMIEGQDTVDKLNAAGSAAGKPKRELTITKTTISVRAKSLPSTAEGANPVLDQFREAATTANLKRDKRWQLAVPDPPAVEFDDSEWVWHMMTDAGPLAVTLSTETAPMQARSVVWLSTLGFYDG
ncbi:MAG: peptidyl-prolyl cis-trans isomerase B (cyclophilin B), partial [Planctomycetota bacterium]